MKSSVRVSKQRGSKSVTPVGERQLSLVILALALAWALSACGKKDESPQAPPPPPPAVTYSYVNGVCQSNAGQVVANTNCPGAPAQPNAPYPNSYPQQGGYPQGNNGYTLVNGVCYYNNQPVEIQRCQNNTATPNSGSCVGTYFYMTYSYWGPTLAQVNCTGTYCSGYFLYNSSNQAVFCR